MAASLWRGCTQYGLAEAASVVLVNVGSRQAVHLSLYSNMQELRRRPVANRIPSLRSIPARSSNCQIGRHGLAFGVSKGTD